MVEFILNVDEGLALNLGATKEEHETQKGMGRQMREIEAEGKRETEMERGRGTKCC